MLPGWIQIEKRMTNKWLVNGDWLAIANKQLDFTYMWVCRTWLHSWVFSDSKLPTSWRLMKLLLNLISGEESQFTYEYNCVHYIKVALWFIWLIFIDTGYSNASFKMNLSWEILSEVCQESHPLCRVPSALPSPNFALGLHSKQQGRKQILLTCLTRWCSIPDSSIYMRRPNRLNQI